ncbi:protein NETWORKED 3A-like [Andrographis paniculata]|uniref:protein NETWORKED 3A-like n=1 Tax=Andrographis paniculata TaxID=175694 RepID=UPI0021E96768|nr:protein NETWORKED 3A-like [Andrographis paniculata]
MEGTKNKESNQCWWFHSHNKDEYSNRSLWLHSTLAELDQKAKAMLNIIHEDADSFAKRAEMYYKKRPELISLVEEFYRSYRSLAERYDRVKSEPQPRLPTPPHPPPLPSSKHTLQTPPPFNDQAYDSFFEAYGIDTCDDISEVDDPVEEQEKLLEDHPEIEAPNKELLMIKREVEKLREENKAQKEELKMKDEEKREVIRQLSLSMEMLREEKAKLRQYCLKAKINQNECSNSKYGFFTAKIARALG